MMGIGSTAIFPKFPKLDTDAALYKFSIYTLSWELNLLLTLSLGIKTTGILSLLESGIFGMNNRPDSLWQSVQFFVYRFWTDLVSCLVILLFMKSNLSASIAGVGGITVTISKIFLLFYQSIKYHFQLITTIDKLDGVKKSLETFITSSISYKNVKLYFDTYEQSFHMTWSVLSYAISQGALLGLQIYCAQILRIESPEFLWSHTPLWYIWWTTDTPS